MESLALMEDGDVANTSTLDFWCLGPGEETALGSALDALDGCWLRLWVTWRFESFGKSLICLFC